MTSRTAMCLASLLFNMLLFTAMPLPALAQDESAGPTIRKDSILATLEAYQETVTRKMELVWTPNFEFDVNKPIAEGDRYSVEASYPGRKTRMTADCEGSYAAEETATFRCKVPINAANFNTFVGLVDFEIHLANELSGKNRVVFRGKMKVVRGPEKKDRQSEYFHVDEDWRIPIGYLSSGYSLDFEVWWFGEYGRDISFHLFHEGKAIAKADVCSNQPVVCSFRNDKANPITELSPGAYEIKVLKEGRLKRTATFTVSEDGSYDNGIASAYKLGSNKVIIPVSAVGEVPRPWDKLAWKTGAFYGNPLPGFTAPP